MSQVINVFQVQVLDMFLGDCLVLIFKSFLMIQVHSLLKFSLCVVVLVDDGVAGILFLIL